MENLIEQSSDYQDTTDAVVSTLRQIIRAIDVQSKRLTKQYGLTGPQLIVLKEFKRSPGLPISKIARKISLSQATVTSILDRLEQQGYAVRHRSTADKRQVFIDLTEKANAILDTHPSLFQEEFTKSFNKLNEWEKNMILSSLQRLSEMMNSESIPSQPVLGTEPI